MVRDQLPRVIDWLLEQPSGWPSASVIHRVLMDPGRGSYSGHRVLAHRPPARIAQVHDAYRLLMPMGQRALWLRYAWLRHTDGTEVTHQDRAAAMGLSVRSYERLLGRARETMVQTVKRPPPRDY